MGTLKLPDITAITLENFKAFGTHTTIPIKPLTILSGMNSSGKSSIYQALLLLEQSKGCWSLVKQNNLVPSLLLNGSHVKLGNISDILHDKNKHTVTIGIKLSSGQEIVSTYTDFFDNAEFSNENINIMPLESQIFKDNNFSYSVKLKNGNYHVEAENYFQFFDSDLSDIIYKWLEEQTKCELEDLPNSGCAKHIELPETKFIKMQNNFLHIVNIPAEDVVRLIHPDILEKVDTNARKTLVDRVDEYIRSDKYPDKDGTIALYSDYLLRPEHIPSFLTNFIPPFRGFPKRFYNALDNECFACDYDKLQTKFINYNYNSNEFVKGTFSEALNYWISFFVGMDVKINVETVNGLIQIVSLEGTTNKLIPINNLGFGISQILPILYKCLSANPEVLLIIDEPETHLHPSIQSKLADFFIQMALLGRKIIVETHSEYILDKLIYHCIKYSKARDVTELYWITNNNSEASVIPVVYDDLGYVNNAPEGFLSEKAKLVEELTALRFEKLDGIDKGNIK